MSLQVWLPLTGDLHNQGLSTTTFSGTPAWKTYGKLANSSLNLQNRITCSTPSLNGVQFFSVAFWGRIEANSDSTANWMDVIGFTDISTGGSSGQFRFETGYGSASQGGIHWHDNATNAIVNGAYTFNTASEQNNWHHIVVTVGDNALKSYYDGVLVHTKSDNLNKGHLNGNWWLGESTTRGCIQDVRIYDHALSDKEVEEIAKGLVLHYRLDNNNIGNENLLLNSLTPTSGNGATGIVKSIENGIQKIVADNPNNNWVTFANHNTTLTLAKGDSFTFSLMIKSPDSDKKPTVYFQNGMGYFSMQGTMSSDWSIIYYTGIWNIDNLATNIHLGFSSAPGTYYIQYFKLEKGTSYTSWAPNHNDQEWSEYGYDNNIIYDSSGYGNDGILHDTTATTTSNSSRYLVCLKNNEAETSTNYLLKGNINMPESSSLTFTWWMNPTQLGKQQSGIFSTSANSLPTDYSTTAANMRDGAFDCCNISGTCVRISVANFITLNEWHYYALVYNGTQLIFYQDGVQKTTANQTGNLKSFTSIFPFYSLAGGVHRTTSGSLSDFRIYATALTAAQILELYHTSATIDNNGNIYARELVEE